MKSIHYLMLVVVIFAAMPVMAHHSGAEFSDKTVEISGTVREFQFKNPHTWIQVLVDTNGKKQEWSIEWGAPNQLARQGYRPSTFPAGAKVTMKIHPMKDGSPAAGFVAAKMEDGKVIGKWE